MFKWISLGLFSVLLSHCALKPPEKKLSVTEQLQVDTARAQSLSLQFSREVNFLNSKASEKFLDSIGHQLSKSEAMFADTPVVIKIHRDERANQKRFFAFPGTLISIPLSFLVRVKYENELAAAIANELANISNRLLAIKVEGSKETSFKLFGRPGVFDFSPAERASSIREGTRLLYLAGYDPRGMASIFSRYAEYYPASASDSSQKQVDFNVREAQKAKSEYLPSLKPIVRSADFIQFKKTLHQKE